MTIRAWTEAIDFSKLTRKELECLSKDGYIERKEGRWHLTSNGEELFHVVGR